MEKRPGAVTTAWIDGIDAELGEVRVSTNPAGGSLQIRGIPAEDVAETRWRVYNALNRLNARNAANGRVAEIRTESGCGQPIWDLPVALAVAQHHGRIPAVGDTIVTGALGHHGKVTGMRGTVPMARLAGRTGRTLMLPAANLGEAGLAGASRLAPVSSIEDAADWLAGNRETVTPAARQGAAPGLRLEDIAGHGAAKRALAIAAAGRHHVLITTERNAPAVGLARRLPAMMAQPTAAERYEALALQSVAGLLDPTGRWTETRPLRAPHWSASAGAIGRDPRGDGHKRPQPGEAALAHNGVLLLDEIDLFGSQTLDRVRRHATGASGCDTRYPHNFLLVGVLVADGKPLEALGRQARRQAAAKALDKTGTADLFDISFDIETARWREAETDGQPTSAAVSDACTRMRRALEENKAATYAKLSTDAAALLRTSATRHGEHAGARIRAVATTIAQIAATGMAVEVREEHVREATALRGILDDTQKHQDGMYADPR